MDYETARNMPPIDMNDPDAIEKTEARLEAYRVEHQRRKAINDYYRRFKTLKGCPGITQEEAAHLTENLEISLRGYLIPFGKKKMDSILGSIRSFERRIADLERRKSDPPPKGWRFEGGEVVMNTEINRVQVIFDERPDLDTIINLKVSGFVQGEGTTWQRHLNDRGIEAARTLFARKG